MLTWCSSAGNICRADWLGCLFDSSSISYPLHVKGDHQWFILYTAASCNVNAFIKKKDSYILTLWLSDKTVNQPRFCFCLEPPMIVWLEHFLFSFSAWHIQITVIKSQHGVSVRPLPPPPNTDTLSMPPLSPNCTLPHPRSPVLRLRGVKCERVLNSNFWVQLLGWVTSGCMQNWHRQSVNKSVCLADRWSREDPCFHV